VVNKYPYDYPNYIISKAQSISNDFKEYIKDWYAGRAAAPLSESFRLQAPIWT
jgi:hypothetical protein